MKRPFTSELDFLAVSATTTPGENALGSLKDLFFTAHIQQKYRGAPTGDIVFFAADNLRQSRPPTVVCGRWGLWASRMP